MDDNFDIAKFEIEVEKIDRYYGSKDHIAALKALKLLSLTLEEGNEWCKKDIKRQLEKIIAALEKK